MKLKVFSALLGLFLIIGVIVAIKAKQFAPPPPFEFPPEVVSTRVAETKSWESVIPTVGSARADQGVMVAPEVGGTVSRIAFESGAVVAAGDVLVELEASIESAQRRAAQAAAELARVNLGRARELHQNGTIAQSELDRAEAEATSAAAQVENIEALLHKKTVRAPFGGRLGIRQVNLGEVITGGHPLVSLQSLDPIQIDFSLPQQRAGEIAVGQVVRVHLDTRADSRFEGRITAIAPQLNATSRTLTVQATLANQDERLRPGMFVRVEVVNPEPVNYVVVPNTAVYFQSFGDTVFVVTEGEGGRRIVEQRIVRVGPSQGDFVALLSGVEAGEEVVTAGVFKLRNGAPVAVDNSQLPPVSLIPTPPNT